MNLSQFAIRCTRNRYYIFALCLIVFTTALELISGLLPVWGHFPTEGVLVLYLYYLLNTIFKQNRYTPYVSALPILWLYALHDVYFSAFRNIPRIADFQK